MNASTQHHDELIDQDRLAKLTHSHDDSKHQLLLMFTENALECICAMEKACANDDGELWLMATGELSSLANVIGAQDFATKVTSAKEARTSLLSERKQVLSAVRSEFDRLRSYFKTHEDL